MRETVKDMPEEGTELEKYKAVAFYLVRLHRVAPEGRKLGKSKREIDDMTVATIKHMAENLDEKVLSDYRRSAYNNNIL